MEEIITRFNTNVRGKIFQRGSITHDGEEGHWIETLMGIKHNAKCESDLFGYEMKKMSSKITLGDWSASEYGFHKKRTIINEYNDWTNDNKISKNQFIEYFGNPNPAKGGRYAWSGKCFPTYGIWNYSGQIIIIDENNNICIYYNYKKDTRPTKIKLPEYLKEDKNYLIAFWKADKLKKHIGEKFNQKGFFICNKKGGIYSTISFGKPFSFEYFIECFKNRKIILDSGMYCGNSRNYSPFRASANNFWKDLIVVEY